MRRLLSAAATASLLLAQAPVLAEGSADDIGVMSVSLKDVVKADFGVQAETQGAGTPNEVGVGGFLPISVGDNSVFYADVEANANLADMGYSSIVNTEVDGVTVSTSSRLGYRWLNDNRSWMFGINAGYDSRPMNTGDAKPFHPVKKAYQNQYHPSIAYAHSPREVFFQQVAAEVEAVSSTWSIATYALVPVGDTEQRLNSHYLGGALDTYGLDVGYFITPDISASVGYYYQQGDLGEADGSGVKGRLTIAIADELEIGGTYTYDNAFDSRASADLTIRFGGGSHKENSKEQAKAASLPQIKALSATSKNRDVRVHDKSYPEFNELVNHLRETCDFLASPSGDLYICPHGQIEVAWDSLSFTSNSGKQIFFGYGEGMGVSVFTGEGKFIGISPSLTGTGYVVITGSGGSYHYVPGAHLKSSVNRGKQAINNARAVIQQKAASGLCQEFCTD